MASKLIDLVVKQKETDQSIIGVLETALEKAKSGLVSGVALVILHDGAVSDSFKLSDNANKFAMLGGIEVLKQDFMTIEIDKI